MFGTEDSEASRNRGTLFMLAAIATSMLAGAQNVGAQKAFERQNSPQASQRLLEITDQARILVLEQNDDLGRIGSLECVQAHARLARMQMRDREAASLRQEYRSLFGDTLRSALEVTQLRIRAEAAVEAKCREEARTRARPAAQPENNGLTRLDVGRVQTQQAALARMESRLAEGEAARLRGECGRFEQAMRDTEQMFESAFLRGDGVMPLRERIIEARNRPCPVAGERPDDILAEAGTERSRDLLRDRAPLEDMGANQSAPSGPALAGRWRIVGDSLNRHWRVVENGAEVRLLSEDETTGGRNAIIGQRHGDVIEVSSTPGGKYVCPAGAPPREPAGASRIAVGADGNTMTLSSRPFTVGSNCSIRLGDWQLSARFEREPEVASAPTSPTTPSQMDRPPPARAMTQVTSDDICPDRMPRDAATLTCRCPAITGEGAVWGTYYYTDDSGLCRSAAHAGAIPTSGGVIRARAEAGRQVYVGSTQFGIASSDYGGWRRTIVFDGAHSAAQMVGSVPACPGGYDGDYLARSSGVCRCPAPTGSGSVWGTDIYTGDSSICRAALHAGAIGGGGGIIRVTALPGQAHYTGSVRNGVTSAEWDGYGNSFAVRAETFQALRPQATPSSQTRPVNASPSPTTPEMVFRDVRWNDEADVYLGDIYEGRELFFQCPAAPRERTMTNGVASYVPPSVDQYPVFGSGPYYTGSSICAAAVHAGVIGFQGGRFRIRAPTVEPPRNLLPGARDLAGSTANGVRTRSTRVDRRNLFDVVRAQ